MVGHAKGSHGDTCGHTRADEDKHPNQWWKGCERGFVFFHGGEGRPFHLTLQGSWSSSLTLSGPS